MKINSKVNVPVARSVTDYVETTRGIVVLVETPSNSRQGQKVARCPTCHVALWSHYAYALAMTIGRGSFGHLNLALLLAAVVGVGLFLHIEVRVASPLVPLAMFRNPLLSAGFALGAASDNIMTASPAAVATGMRYTFAVAAALIVVALAIASASHAISHRTTRVQ